MVIDVAFLQRVLGPAYNPQAHYSIYGREIRGRGPRGRKVGEIKTSNDTLSIYEWLPEPPPPTESPKPSTTKEPTSARRQPVRR